MPHYEIRRPCRYVADGKPVIHKEAGAVVELRLEQAAKLGGRVKPVAPPKPAEPPSAPPITVAAPQQPSAPKPGEAVTEKGK